MSDMFGIDANSFAPTGSRLIRHPFPGRCPGLSHPGPLGHQPQALLNCTARLLTALPNVWTRTFVDNVVANAAALGLSPAQVTSLQLRIREKKLEARGWRLEVRRRWLLVVSPLLAEWQNLGSSLNPP